MHMYVSIYVYTVILKKNTIILLFKFIQKAPVRKHACAMRLDAKHQQTCSIYAWATGLDSKHQQIRIDSKHQQINMPYACTMWLRNSLNYVQPANVIRPVAALPSSSSSSLNCRCSICIMMRIYMVHASYSLVDGTFFVPICETMGRYDS